MCLNSLKKRICRISARERMSVWFLSEKRKKKERRKNFETNIFYIWWLLLGICLFESKPVIFLILLSVPFHRNKGINVFEIRVETLLFKPMDKLTRYSVITPLKDPMRNLIGSFLSLSSPSLSLLSLVQTALDKLYLERKLNSMYANYLRRFSKIYLNFHESEKLHPNTKRRNFEMIIFQNSKEPG